MKIPLTIIFLFCTLVSFSQNNHSESVHKLKCLSLKTTALAGSKDNLPFWFLHNQLGKYSSSGSWQELTEGNLSGFIPLTGKLKLSYGTDMAFLISDNSTDVKIIQAFAGFSGKTLSLKAGAFADDEILGGLSASNGNIVRSLNYRPYPMIRFSTSDFIPFLFAKKWFRFKAEYDEGLLRDKRIVYHPHMHHKSLELLFKISKSLRFTAGMNHYVFWGGTLTNGWKQPHNLKAYFRYILGKQGISDFLQTDQGNVAGNHLGSYLLTAEKDLENYQLQIRLSHPFEDHSGMEFANMQDNMYSFYIKKNETGSLIDGFLFEFLYTKNQSGSKPERGRDNYFNHGVYKTGFSYRGYSMGTPLFFPLVKNEDGTMAGFENNRVSAFHAGAKGYLAKPLTWTTMLTYSRNFGTYGSPYTPVHKQVYSLIELSWESEACPFVVSSRLAADFGDQTENQFGLGFSFKWTIR